MNKFVWISFMIGKYQTKGNLIEGTVKLIASNMHMWLETEDSRAVEYIKSISNAVKCNMLKHSGGNISYPFLAFL